MVKDPQDKTSEKWLRSVGMLSLEKRRLTGDLIFLKGGSGGEGADLFPW